MHKKKILRDLLISAVALCAAFVLSVVFQRLDVEEHVTTIFVFAVFMISLFTEGYVFGILSAVVGTIAVNFAFTYPYFAFDFMTPVNLVSALILLAVAIITGMLTTRSKAYEEAKAESTREKMRASLLRAVSHDLRTPLTAIYSASAVLRDEKASLTKEQEAQMLSNIHEDAEWLVRMVENLLSVTRIDNETMKITKTPTILDELIDSSLTKFSSRHPGQRVEVTLPADIVTLSADALLVEQVLLNLLENAVYHAKGMTHLWLSVSAERDAVVFTVADDGCGIEEHELKSLFSGDWEQHRDTANESRRYAGIGLEVCAAIVRAHGGRVTAGKRRGGGACFCFTIEREKPSDDEQQT